MDGKKDPTKHL